MSEIKEDYIHIIGKPQKMVMFLHGYDQDAKLINKLLSKNFLENLEDCVVVIPSAPHLCEVNKNKRQWYSMQEIDPTDERKKLFNDFTAVEKIYGKANIYIKGAFETLSSYIEEKLQEYKLKPKDLCICGFSQGASLGLYTGLMSKEKIGSVVSFSGILCPATVLLDHYKNNFQALLIHGKADDFISFEALNFSKINLEKMGCHISTYAIDNTKHFITEDALLIASSFINAKK